MPKPLKRLGLPVELLSKLEAAGIKATLDLFRMTKFDLCELGFLPEECSTILDAASHSLLPPLKTAAELLCAQDSFVPLGFAPLDAQLSGGLCPGTITEIVGPSGCGKTQFCLTAAATVSRMDDAPCRGNVLYIDTEGSFSSERLVEIAQSRISDPNTLVEQCSRIHVMFVDKSTKLMELINQLEDILIEKEPKLIILDSVASLFRKEYTSSSTVRADLLAKIAATLKRYSQEYHLPVLVTNQVTSKITEESHGHSIVTAALGNSWAHNINTRVTLSYVQMGSLIRRAHVVKSPLAPSSSHLFCIGPEGVMEAASSLDTDASVVNSSVPSIGARDNTLAAYARPQQQFSSIVKAQANDFDNN